jgi:flagellar motility protein MotE (MotC chaperone)
MGLVLNGGYIFDDRNVASVPSKQSPRLSWAQDVFNFPSHSRSAADPVDVTGSVEGKKEKKEDPSQEKKADAKRETKSDDKGGMKSSGASDSALTPDQNRPVPASERAILERLQERRQEIEARAREIDIRENLLKAAERRIEGKVEEMKAVESRIGSANEQKSQTDAARFKGIVTMYEAMKPKDAAKIFDRLEMSVLIEVASQIAPRKMSDIVGLMQPEAAERLTVEMARRAGGDKTASNSDLPKIEGKSMMEGSN